MKKPPTWSVLVSLSLSCGTSCSAPAAAPMRAVQPTLSAPEPHLVPAVDPVDQELKNRGLIRTDAHPQVAPPNWTETMASLYILARTRGGQVGLVSSGAQLHTGERIQLHVSVGRPAYVYLIQISAGDEATILYPVTGEPEKMVPGTDYRMPANAQVDFELDDHVGTERLAFVVTEQAIAFGDSGVRTLIERLRATGRWASEPEREMTSRASVAPAKPENPRSAPEETGAPVHGIGGVRGFVRSTANTGRALDVQPDDRGVAVAIFTFQHIP